MPTCSAAAIASGRVMVARSMLSPSPRPVFTFSRIVHSIPGPHPCCR